MMVRHYFALNHGNHGIAATETEEAYEEKGVEELKIDQFSMELLGSKFRIRTFNEFTI